MPCCCSHRLAALLHPRPTPRLPPTFPAPPPYSRRKPRNMCCGVKLQFLGLAPSTPESAPPCLLNFASGQRGYSSQHVGLNKGPRLPHVHISSCPSVQFNFIDFIGFFPPNLACFCLDSCALLASLCSYPIQAEKGRDPICYQLLDTFALAASN